MKIKVYLTWLVYCTVLMYYAGEGLKKSTSLGYHTNCVYSPATGEYLTKPNLQKANTPAIIYSIGDKSRLKWKCRHSSDNIKGRKVWKQKNDDKLTTITIIHSHDEISLSEKNKKHMS